MTKTSRKKAPKPKQTSTSGAKSLTSEDQYFWVNNGPICGNMSQLQDAVKTMSDEQFMYHTKREGNDFAKWIDDVLGDTTRAKKVGRARTRAGVLRALGAK